MAYEHAVEIWNEVSEKYKDKDPEKASDDIMTDMLEIIRKMPFDELQKLASQYFGKKPMLDAAKEMSPEASYKDFLMEVVWVAGFDYSL